MWLFLLIPLGLLALGYLGLMVYGIISYGDFFQRHFDGGGDYFPYFSAQFPTWNRREVSFLNNRGDRLRGFVFSYDHDSPKGLVVVYHGYGMGLDDYLPECEFFCRNGYQVLAFDGSGTGHSDGILHGLPQHILDLKSCLDYIRQEETLSSLPLLIYGHSWGGYAADSVGAVGSWDIRGIVSASAFSTDTAALAEHIRRHYSFLGKPVVQGIKLVERHRYGAVAKLTAVEGLANQTCPVLVTQSDDDRIIRFRDGYKAMEQHFHGDPRFVFLPLSGRNHNITTPPEIDAQKRKLLKVLTGENPPKAAIEEINRLKTFVDYGLLSRFVLFFDDCIGDCTV